MLWSVMCDFFFVVCLFFYFLIICNFLVVKLVILCWGVRRVCVWVGGCMYVCDWKSEVNVWCQSRGTIVFDLTMSLNEPGTYWTLGITLNSSCLYGKHIAACAIFWAFKMHILEVCYPHFRLGMGWGETLWWFLWIVDQEILPCKSFISTSLL